MKPSFALARKVTALQQRGKGRSRQFDHIHDGAGKIFCPIGAGEKGVLAGLWVWIAFLFFCLVVLWG
jgi:hypothetical protein